MEKDNMIIILLAIVIVITALQTIQLVTLNLTATGAATAGNGVPDMTGWTDQEKMNYEMHGIIPARAGGSPAGSGMVGGC